MLTFVSRFDRRIREYSSGSFQVSDFHYMVGQGFIAAAAGTVVLVQPELVPVPGAAIVIVGLGYITYKVAQKIAQSSSTVHPIDIRQVCYDQLCVAGTTVPDAD
jgi:hypothetical protein